MNKPNHNQVNFEDKSSDILKAAINLRRSQIKQFKALKEGGAQYQREHQSHT